MVVVRVKGYVDFFVFGDVVVEVFDLVGIDVWGGYFDGCWEVENDGVFFGWVLCFFDSFVDFDNKFWVGI